MNPTRRLGIGLLLGLAACATSPLGRSQMMLVSDAEMDKMGVEAFEQVKQEQKLSNDASANAYVTCVANAVTRVLPEDAGAWEVRVFEDEDANAFALPGRKIGVHMGLLGVAKNQDQLATVIGHEVGHVIARHGAERVSNQIVVQGGAQLAGSMVGAAGDPASPLNAIAQAALGLSAQGVVLKYSRTHESEADLLGLDYMAKAGFDPRESVALWQNMEAASKGARPPELLSTHPSPATRIEDLQARMPQALPLAEQARAQGRKPRCR
jgi:predicted Zn-dependent protease